LVCWKKEGDLGGLLDFKNVLLSLFLATI